MNSLGWSRRDPDIPVNTSHQSGLFSSLSSLNPFQGRGYVQLPTTESSGAPLPAATRREEDEGWLTCKSPDPHLASSWPFLLPFLRDISRGPCRLACGHMGIVLVSHVNDSGPLHLVPVRGHEADFWRCPP